MPHARPISTRNAPTSQQQNQHHPSTTSTPNTNHRQFPMPHTLVARHHNPSPNSHRRTTPTKRRHPTHPTHPTHPDLKERYRIHSRLGHGFMGTVYRAFDNTDRTEVAIKVVLKSSLHDNLERRSLKREVGLLQRFKHKHIMAFRHAFEDENAVYIVSEYCERGDLFNYLNKNDKPIPEREVLKYMRQLLHALHYLNRNGISHRDIKPENILLSSDGNIKLADFGLCFCRPPNGSLYAQRHCGTPQYSAPEIINRSRYVPEKSDMWSCGVMLYAMLTQKLPFDARDMRQLQRDIICADAERIVASPALRHVTSGTKRLIAALLSLDPNKRPFPMQAVGLVDDALLGPRIYKSKHMPW